MAKWLIAALLAVIATCLLIEVGAGRSAARTGAGQTGAGDGVFAVAGQVSEGTYGLYLVDPDHGSICMYRWEPGERTLRLMAARTFIYDRQLDAYNTELQPAEIRKLVNRQKRLGETGDEPAPGEE
ncbi:MAG: hypothetical protein ACOC8F_06480 [Planctomycetota bacterium]